MLSQLSIIDAKSEVGRSGNVCLRIWWNFERREKGGGGGGGGGGQTDRQKKKKKKKKICLFVLVS